MTLRWVILPTRRSSSFADVVLLSINLLTSLFHATYLFSGKVTRSLRKSKSHPRIVLVSSSPASAASLLRAGISSRGIGSDSCFGRAAAWIARRGADSKCLVLSVPGISTASAKMSSMYTSDWPLGFTGISIASFFALPKGMLSRRESFWGTSFW